VRRPWPSVRPRVRVATPLPVDSDATETEVPQDLADHNPADIAAPPAVPDELERILTEDEEIERKTREHHETPHFRKEVD